MTRSAPLPALALALALAPCFGCERGELVCDGGPEITGTASFEGESHSFDRGSAVIYMAGTAEHPCIEFANVTARGETGGLEVVLQPSEGGGPLEITYVSFGPPISPEDYGVWGEDIPKFSETFDLEERNDDCAHASVEVTGTDARMFLSGSEDWGPYMLTDIELSVDGTWTIEWLDEACE